MKRILAIFTLLTLSSLAFAACGGDDPEPTATTSSGVASGGGQSSAGVEGVMLKAGDDPRPPSGALDTSKTYTATFKTDAGEFEILLFDDEAPLTVENFINLATIGFYDGLVFHRVIEAFMAQGGDPTGTGSGGPGYRFIDEFDATRRHSKPGILSMANSGSNTNGSQFFITFGPQPHLDDKHSVFGEVVGGLDNSLNLNIGDVIETIIISES